MKSDQRAGSTAAGMAGASAVEVVAGRCTPYRAYKSFTRWAACWLRPEASCSRLMTSASSGTEFQGFRQNINGFINIIIVASNFDTNTSTTSPRPRTVAAVGDVGLLTSSSPKRACAAASYAVFFASVRSVRAVRSNWVISLVSPACAAF